MVRVLWKDECEITSEEFMKKSTHNDVMKVILKKFEDKDGCKGRGSIHVISIPMRKFKAQEMKPDMKCFKFKYVLKR
jgi:hypothetical protein